MDSHRIAVKFFVEDASAIKADEFVPIFHSWIQTQAVPDHLLVDVTDYAHVFHGPGTLLIAHEANFSTDRAEGRLGLMYARKQPAPGTFTDRLRQAFAATLEACQRLQQDQRLADRIKFRTDEAMIRINDRLLAPNTSETFNSIRDQLQQFLSDLYGNADVSLEQTGTPETPFEVRVRASKAPPITELLSRLAGSAATPAPSR